MKRQILKIQDLNIYYQGQQVIKDFAVNIPRNKITALIGASGSGKSTILRAINRMHDNLDYVKVEGVIEYEGVNILDKDFDPIELRKKIGMLFQSPTPFYKTVYDNIAYGLEIQGYKNHRKAVLGLINKKKIDPDELVKSDDHIDQTVVSMLKNVSLWDELKHRLGESAQKLSGGQQQRLCIARALAIEPSVLLLDEPCSSLDPYSTQKVEALLMELKDVLTIVIVTHNLSQAKRISDYIIHIHEGELVSFGDRESIFNNPQNKLTYDYINGHFG